MEPLRTIAQLDCFCQRQVISAEERLARQLRGLPHPVRQELLSELVVLVDVEVVYVLRLDSMSGMGWSDMPRRKVTSTYLVKRW